MLDHFLSQILVLLGTAVVVVVLFHRRAPIDVCWLLSIFLRIRARRLPAATPSRRMPRFIVLNVFGAPFEGRMLEAGIAEEVVREYRVKAEREAQTEMRRFIKATAVGTDRVHHSVAYGDHAPTTLREKAVEIDADLMVLGKHGQSLGEQLLLGSVTLHMLSECPCDVLVTQ